MSCSLQIRSKLYVSLIHRTIPYHIKLSVSPAPLCFHISNKISFPFSNKSSTNHIAVENKLLQITFLTNLLYLCVTTSIALWCCTFCLINCSNFEQESNNMYGLYGGSSFTSLTIQKTFIFFCLLSHCKVCFNSRSLLSKFFCTHILKDGVIM